MDQEASVHDAFARAEVPRQVSLTVPRAVDHTRIEGWMFGRMMLFSPDSPGLRVVRTPKLEPMDPIVALIVQTRGTAMFIENGRSRRLKPGELLMAEPTSPNDYVLSGTGSAFQIPFKDIGLSFESIHTASERLRSSPLFPLVSRHLLTVRQEADTLNSSAASGISVAIATTHLVRALFVSAVEDERGARTALAEVVLPRVVDYVRQHLTDHELTPASIAGANDISIRYLYKVCESAGIRLMEWIMEERLEGARATLLSPAGSQQSVAAIARRWGFTSPSHFSARFRRAYGVSPRDLLGQSQREYRDRL
jgi:AraC-like DNA-binding protein